MHNGRIKNQELRTQNLTKKQGYATICFIFVFLVFCFSAFAEEKEFKKGCRACHKEILDKWDSQEMKHFPYAQEKCESCHAAEHKKFTAEVEKPCLICHDLASEKIKKAHFSTNLSGVNCFNCHYTHSSDKRGLLKESVHAPFASGMCDACHNLSPAGKIEVKKEQKKVCLTCHSNLVNKDDTFIHGAYEMLDCADCHNPHTASENSLLEKRVTEICFQCHDKSEAQKHPYDVVPSKKIILDKNNKIWLTYTKEISCVSCHEPHSARIPFLLRESLKEGKLCYNCHIKQ